MKSTIIATIIGGSLVIATLILVQGGNEEQARAVPISNVTVENGKQIIDISAKGGYSPRLTTAKADTPTLLRVATTGTFDCSSALSLPALNYQKNLPPSGVTEIELPPQKAGSVFEGQCSMGMYGFKIAFE